MKKKFICLYVLLALFCFLTACDNTEKTDNEKQDNPIIECNDIFILVGDSYTISPITNINDAKVNFQLEGNCATLKDNILTANETGTCTVTISFEGYNVTKVVNVTCAEEGFIIVGSKTVVINETTNLTIQLVGIEDTDDVIWRSNNNNIGRVSKGVVTGVGFGKFVITAKNDDYEAKFEMEVIRPTATNLVVEEDKEEVVYEVNATYSIKHYVEPELALDDIIIESNTNKVIVNEDNSIKANELGEATLKVTSVSNPSLVKEIKVKVMNNEAPVFTKLSNYQEVITVNFASTVSATQGLQVIDNSDGDITELVTTEGTSDLLQFGEYEITLVAIDRAGNKSTFKRTVNVEWQYNTKFIGHQGCFYGVPNTEDAFIYAASVLHYQAMECDLRSTKDGVLVVNHDDTFGGVSISKTNYADLLKATATSKQFGLPATYYGNKTYTAHICTFDRYLDICKEYNCMPIIELKGAAGMSSGDTSQLLNLMNILKKKGLYESSVILTSMGDCITYLRKKGETVKCQYLVTGASSDSVLDFCITNKCDVSVNVTYGDSITDAYIKKYHDAGCEVSVWTFTSYCDYNQVQAWIDKGVDYLTCDWHYLDKGLLTFK